jgi:CRISPR/Cas system-associated protein Csm6
MKEDTKMGLNKLISTSQIEEEKFIKRSMDIPRSVADDLKILTIIEKTSQRQLLAKIITEYIEENKEKIQKVKKALA